MSCSKRAGKSKFGALGTLGLVRFEFGYVASEFVPLPLEQQCQFSIVHLVQSPACQYHYIQRNALGCLAYKLTRDALDSIPLYRVADILFGDNQAQTMSGPIIYPCQEKQVTMESFGIRFVKHPAVVPGIEKTL